MHAITKVKAVPFLDLSVEFAELEGEWLAAIKASGEKGSFVLGPNVTALEQEFAAYVGSKYAVAVANGTDALVLSLRALDIGPGDEVITTPFTFFATAEAVTLVGAKPVFADIDPVSFCLDPDSVRALVNKRTRAIIPVHLYGHPASMDAMREIAGRHGLRLIEDCAQAFGATVGGAGVGSLGDTGAFSFYPTKVLGCYGDGGMITTSDAGIAQRLRTLRNHGATQPFMHAEIGYNSRLDEIQAALLRIKLRRIDRAIAGRRRVAAEYTQRLADLPLATPATARDTGHVFNLYTIRTAGRDEVRRRLTEAQIASSVCYPLPLHLQAVYSDLGYRAGSLVQAEQAAGEALSLPIYPEMETAQVALVCDALRAAIA